MKNGAIHDRVLADPIIELLHELGARVHPEHFIRGVSKRGFIDVFAEVGNHRIAVEIELLPRRLSSDIWKARAANTPKIAAKIRGAA